MQDEVSQKVAGALRLNLTAAAEARWRKRYTSNAGAYDYYLKGMRSLDRRGVTRDRKPDVMNSVEMFRKAIELDPNYALAHAQLADAYAWLAVVADPDPKWLAAYREELSRAESLDSELAETRIARYELLWSSYEGFNMAEAIRVLREADKLDPTAVHQELGVLYSHVGLEGPAIREFERRSVSTTLRHRPSAFSERPR